MISLSTLVRATALTVAASGCELLAYDLGNTGRDEPDAGPGQIRADACPPPICEAPWDSGVVSRKDGGDPEADATSSDGGAFDAGGSDAARTDATPGGRDGATIPNGATVLARELDEPVSIAVDEVNVYWTERTGRVMRRRHSGGDATLLAEGQASPEGLVADSTHVYWLVKGTQAQGFRDGAVMRAPRDGSAAATAIAPDQQGVAAIAMDSDFVYWSQAIGGSGSVRKISKRAPGAPIEVPMSRGSPGAIAIEGLYIYVAHCCDDPRIERILSDGSRPAIRIAWAPEVSETGALSAFYGQIQFSNLEEEAVWRVPGGGGMQTRLAAEQGQVRVIRDDASGTYWADRRIGRVMWLPRSMNDALPVATGQISVGDLALDASSIYWTVSVGGGAGMVLKLPKPSF